MFGYVWPILLVVFSNVLYQICAKGVPEEANPFASLIVTYTVGALCSAVMYFLSSKQTELFKEISKMNYAPYLLGVVLVGLEVGFIYAYKAGWQVGTASLVQSAFLAVILIFVGFFIYHETLTWNKILGALICLLGLFFMNLK